MAIQNFHENLPSDRQVIVIDVPDVLERRHWLVSWVPFLRYRRHKQFVCWRDTSDEKAYVSPEFLRRVCGRQNIRKIQCDRFWFGVPTLEANKARHAAGDGKSNMSEAQKARLEKLREKHKR